MKLQIIFKEVIRSPKMFYYNRVAVPYRKFLGELKFNTRYQRTVSLKKCYFGPFTGEFGHLLGHNLPFIAHLYSKGVEVEFCGMEIHKPFFVDSKGRVIVNSFLSMRDFFQESLPDCNSAPEPSDVKEISQAFITKAKRSGLPFWDFTDKFLYFESFRWWALRKDYIKVFDLSKVYKTKDENSVVIFPSKENPLLGKEKENRNNGESWNYRNVAEVAARHFEKVYVLGHPSFSVGFESFDNVEVSITNDNAYILQKCCNSKLIISQHSGTVYLGEYTNTPVLIIYKGGRQIGDIEITRQFKNGLGTKHEFSYAFSIDEIDKFLSKQHETVRN